jgi:deazaflavin-dependent oxidoreductase (nitroreductase family)
MKRKRKWLWLGLAAGGLFLAKKQLYDRRPLERVVGHEALDDPEISAAFNQVARLPQFRLMRNLVARRAIGFVGQGKAADLGCGPGLLVLELARQAPGLHLTGVDLAEEMLAAARRLAAEAGVGARVTFKQGDVEALPFPDESLDLVVSTLSLHHWFDPVRALEEVYRVLRPGGAYVIADLRRDLGLFPWLAVWFATQVVVPPALKRVNEPLASRDASYTPAEAAALADQAGLEGHRITKGPLWLILEGIKGRALRQPLPLQWRIMRALNREVAGRVKPDEKAGDLVLLLQTTGRVTGRPHNTFLQYELWDGVYTVGSARGPEADWFRNLVANPEVRVRLKGTWHTAQAKPVTDPERVLAFLEYRLERHPNMIRGMLLTHGLPLQPTREDLAALTENLTLAKLEIKTPTD